MSTPPSSYAVMNAVVELSQIREQLLAICPDMETDDALFHDMMQGEGGDSLAVIERLIEASVESDALADAAKARKADIAERQTRFERRRDAYRTVALQALEAINMRRLETAAWTASVANRAPKVMVDEARLGDQWFRVKREPDKAALATALKAGEQIEGASLSNGGVGLTVRTR